MPWLKWKLLHIAVNKKSNTFCFLYIVCKFRINANEKSLLGVADATLSSDFFCYHNGRITYVFIYYIFHLRKEEEKMGYQLRTESLRKVFDAWSKSIISTLRRYLKVRDVFLKPM